MANSDDYRNGSGYFSNTENTAIYNIEREKSGKPNKQKHRVRVMRFDSPTQTEAERKRDSFIAYCDNIDKEEENNMAFRREDRDVIARCRQLKQRGVPYDVIAELTCVSLSTVQRYLSDKYTDDGDKNFMGDPKCRKGAKKVADDESMRQEDILKCLHRIERIQMDNRALVTEAKAILESIEEALLAIATSPAKKEDKKMPVYDDRAVEREMGIKPFKDIHHI